MNIHKKTQTILLLAIAVMLAAIVFQKDYSREAQAVGGAGVGATSGFNACVWSDKTEGFVLIDPGAQIMTFYAQARGGGLNLFGARTFKWDFLLEDTATIRGFRPTTAWARGVDVKTIYKAVEEENKE